MAGGCVADLVPRPPFAGLDLPLSLGGVTLAALPDGARAVIVPFCDRSEAAAEALGAPLPDPGRWAARANGGWIAWSGLGQWMLSGDAPDLSGSAAVCDQSDGWAGLALTGAGAVEVLARLVPIDLASAAPGAAARTQVGHVACLLRRVEDGFEIHVMRSFARTAAEETAHALRAVAARGRIG